MNTIISPNIKKTSERIDPQGNIINPKTKEIIRPNTQEYIPTPEEQAIVSPQATEAPTVVVSASRTPKVIQEEIVAVEAKLELLKEEKKAKIEEMRKELEELEA